MAAKARGEGDDNYADELTAKANELLDWANNGGQPAAAGPPKSGQAQ